MNRRTGRHCRPVLQLPTGQTVQLAATMILVHMDMDKWGQSKMNGGKNVEEGSGHGMAKASRHKAC